MASRRASLSRASTPIIHLSCGQCNAQLGIFENEWTRLTSSYARAKHNGRHVGTEIGNRIQHVPTGGTQKAAEGCGMAEIFCKKCSNLVGQYCRSAPNPEKQYLVDNYFYKLSRTYLTDPQTLQRVEPVFGYAGDCNMPPPRSRPSVRPSARPRMSTRPSVVYTPRDSLGTFSEVDADSRQSLDRNSFAEMREDSIVAERLSYLERRISDYESEGFLQSRAMTPVVGSGYGSHNGSMERSISQQTTEQDTVVEDQRKQITALSGQIETLNGTIQDLRRLIEEMRSTKQPAVSNQAPRLAESSNTPTMSNFEEMVNTIKRARTQQSELADLRDENKQLRDKFAMIESAMGMKPGTVAQLDTGTHKSTTLGTIPNLSEGEQTTASDRSRSLHTPQSDTQLPTPAASQQQTADADDGIIKAAMQAPQEDVPESNTGSTVSTVANGGGEKMEAMVASADEVHIDDDSVQVGGDDDVDELPTGEPTSSGSQSIDDVGPSGHRSVSGEAILPGSDVYPGQFAPRAANPRATQSNRQSTLKSTDLSPIEAVPAEKLPTNRPLFGVIKPMSARSSRKRKSDPQIQYQEEENPGMPAPQLIDQDLVYFSDDENPAPQVKTAPPQQAVSMTPMGLVYGRGRPGPPAAPGVSPWSQLTPVPMETVATNIPGSSSRPDSAGLGLDEFHFNVMGPEDVRQRLERAESGIKEPREKKPVIQTTEKLLNEELMELGLGQWIGKEKNTKEYRQAIDQARAEKRERNKQEALAKAGIVNPGVTVPPAPLVAPAPKRKPGRPPRKHNTLQSLRRKHSRPSKVAKPLADVTDQQNAQTTVRTSRKRKVESMEEDENPNVEENVGAPATKPKKRTKKGKSQGFWPGPEPATDNQEAGIKTRSQMREADIEKLDKLAQEAMEMEEAT